MKNNETGEFELVVGNRQLLSGFFIVVLLFAVAFAMGYVVGQNSQRSAKTAEASVGAPPADRPQPVSAPPSAAPPAPAEQAAAAPAAGDNAAPPAEPESTQPGAQPAPQPGAAPSPPASQTASELPPGTCWQVMAVGQQDAEVVVRALKDKGFPALTAPGPNNLTRVLVGPYDNTQAMAQAKTELESAGFHPIRK